MPHQNSHGGISDHHHGNLEDRLADRRQSEPMETEGPIAPAINPAGNRSLDRQLRLFLHLAALLRQLAVRIPWDGLPFHERRALRRELADLKRTLQAARRQSRGQREPRPLKR